MNWLESLQQFRDNNPDLPEGNDPAPDTTADTDSPKRHPRLDIYLEKKGRGGKTATLISGWGYDDGRLLEIAATLKQKLGVGGSARGGDILIQGDNRQKVLDHLTAMGYKARII